MKCPLSLFKERMWSVSHFINDDCTTDIECVKCHYLRKISMSQFALNICSVSSFLPPKRPVSQVHLLPMLSPTGESSLPERARAHVSNVFIWWLWETERSC